MDDLGTGLQEAFVGAVSSFVGIGIISQFAEDGLIPWYLQVTSMLVIFILDVAAIEKLNAKGILYIVGWVIGSFLVINMLNAVGIIMAIVVPILMILYKFWDTIKKLFINY